MQMQQTRSLNTAGIQDASEAVGERLTLIGKIALRLSAMVVAGAEERGRRRAIRELRRFDSHMLADVGIKRSEIEQAVRHGCGGL